MRMQICFDLSCLFSDVSVAFVFYVCSAVFFLSYVIVARKGENLI